MDNLYIRKILNGDYSGFSYFIDKYKDMAYSIAFRILNDCEDAEEIVQDSFLKAFDSLKKFRQDSKFSTWFYRIVVNNALTKAKRKKLIKKDNDFSKIENIEVEKIETVYSALSQDDRKKYINFALDKLNIEDRLILTLYYLNENSLEEIVEITNIKRENLKMKIHRARQKMYLILEQELKTEVKDLL
ncbi:RNA polymerase sigma factor [Plebeiibacterium sediminum]|uniref:RNA polymerase sigma factor n=1 Tax=Plebeiibacterium sediminum TaxID=2992112 RepID=A0AAE3M9K8_9BACT|nr:sigma-70 family RNA polymerase sigma factor [Plebeiobacterium sediminum]MCW3789593.1 sigma-70 family RNA polymerase sigma factor [Plebeiobacterium sediminum]